MASAQSEVDPKELTVGPHNWAMSIFLKEALICATVRCLPQVVRAIQLLAKNRN